MPISNLEMGFFCVLRRTRMEVLDLLSFIDGRWVTGALVVAVIMFFIPTAISELRFQMKSGRRNG
jgi:hypothetical protein